ITGQKKLAIKLEGHGREEIHEKISIDRTVGWFTNVYTVTLECSEDNDKAIINAKDTIRNVPNMGMGFGYVDHETMPDICFNYLGDFGKKYNGQSVIYSCGESISGENTLPDDITINGCVTNSKLIFNIISSSKKYSQEFIDRFKIDFVNSVITLADFCNDVDKKQKTITDLRDKELEDSELDILNDLFS
uniref:condensation domain-containing protein n=1 Tax=Ruminococcus flavefaciens TaxID=1265 RepID=UPI00055D5AB5